MAGSEANMWRTVRKHMAEADLDPVRVENPACPGTPDVNYVDGWLELKYLPEWPKRESTKIKIKHFTAEQRLWLKRRIKADGYARILLKIGTREWVLFSGLGAIEALYHGRLIRTDLTLLSTDYEKSGFSMSSTLGMYIDGEYCHIRYWHNGLDADEFIDAIT